MRTRAQLCIVLLCSLAALLVSCSGSDAGPSSRVVAIHNALHAMGFSQVGEISEGSLEQGRSSQFTFEIENEACYVFVAFGGPGVSNIDLQLVSPGGVESGTDDTSDRQAVIQHCAEESGEHSLEVTMTSGQGRYLLAQWAGGEIPVGAGVSGSGGGGGGSRAEGSCGNPIALEFGQTVSGNTSEGTDQGDGTCVPSGSPDVAYEFTLQDRSQVCIDMTSTYDGAVFLQSECGQSHTEVTCNDDAPDTRHSGISETLDAGTYYLLVSGFNGASGTFSVTANVAESQDPQQICSSAPVLSPGQSLSGTTAGCLPDTFQATCAAGARSPEKVYRLNVQKRSRVRIDGTTSTHDGAIYVRSNCTDPATEVACNDDAADSHTSMITTTLDPGTYYVFADGYAENNKGAYTLRAQMAALGGTVAGDSCANAAPLTSGHVRGSTMAASGDVTGTCASNPAAPDLVYAVNITEASRLRARMTKRDMRSALYLQSTCGDRSSEITCDTSGSIERNLDPGTYYLVVDGLDQNQFGDFEMDVEVRTNREMLEQCTQAPILAAGSPATGATSGSDEHHASCAGGAMSSESIYRLNLRRRQLVRLSLESSFDGAIYIRRDCLDEETELACNDDHLDSSHSMVETTLDRGNYFVFVDGYRTGNQGQYTLRLELENP